MQEYANLVVETKLKKFYSQINQAIQLSEAEYGAKEYWYTDTNNISTDADGKPIPGSSTGEKWFMKYIGSHMTVIKVDYDEKAFPTFYFKDGTALKLMAGSIQTSQDTGLRDWTFYTSYPTKCLKQYGSEENARGKCAFVFIFNPTSEQWQLKKQGFEPYKYGWDGSRTYLENRCKGSGTEYCTALIQQNNWKIPEESPYKVLY